MGNRSGDRENTLEKVLAERLKFLDKLLSGTMEIFKHAVKWSFKEIKSRANAELEYFVKPTDRELKNSKLAMSSEIMRVKDRKIDIRKEKENLKWMSL